MKRITLVSIATILAGVGMVWAGNETYKLVMSKDKEVCGNMLESFNKDMATRGKLNYEHEAFSRIPWKDVDMIEDEGQRHECRLIRQAIFDINNDGHDDLVIKYSGCFHDQLSDGLFVFQPDSDVLAKIKPGPGGLAVLFSSRDKFDPTGRGYSIPDPIRSAQGATLPALGGVFVLQPFIWGQKSYVSITDLHQEWIIITKYLRGESLEDVCYLHGKSALKSE